MCSFLVALLGYTEHIESQLPTTVRRLIKHLTVAANIVFFVIATLAFHDFYRYYIKRLLWGRTLFIYEFLKTYLLGEPFAPTAQKCFGLGGLYETYPERLTQTGYIAHNVCKGSYAGQHESPWSISGPCLVMFCVWSSIVLFIYLSLGVFYNVFKVFLSSTTWLDIQKLYDSHRPDSRYKKDRSASIAIKLSPTAAQSYIETLQSPTLLSAPAITSISTTPTIVESIQLPTPAITSTSTSPAVVGPAALSISAIKSISTAPVIANPTVVPTPTLSISSRTTKASISSQTSPGLMPSHALAEIAKLSQLIEKQAKMLQEQKIRLEEQERRSNDLKSSPTHADTIPSPGIQFKTPLKQVVERLLPLTPPSTIVKTSLSNPATLGSAALSDQSLAPPKFVMPQFGFSNLSNAIAKVFSPISVQNDIGETEAEKTDVHIDIIEDAGVERVDSGKAEILTKPRNRRSMKNSKRRFPYGRGKNGERLLPDPTVPEFVPSCNLAINQSSPLQTQTVCSTQPAPDRVPQTPLASPFSVPKAAAKSEGTWRSKSIATASGNLQNIMIIDAYPEEEDLTGKVQAPVYPKSAGLAGSWRENAGPLEGKIKFKEWKAFAEWRRLELGSEPKQQVQKAIKERERKQARAKAQNAKRGLGSSRWADDVDVDEQARLKAAKVPKPLELRSKWRPLDVERYEADVKSKALIERTEFVKGKDKRPVSGLYSGDLKMRSVFWTAD